MSRIHIKALDKEIETGHLIGHYNSGNPGPLLFIMAGIHGNESSAIVALQRIFEELEKEEADLNGTFVGLAGNLMALEKGVRYIDEDMNRIWTPSNIARIKNKDYRSTEEEQTGEILEILDEVNLNRHEEVYFLDCHTTSSESQPYLAMHYHPRTYHFSRHFPVYIVKEEETRIEGTFDTYWNQQGATGFCFEAGQHDDLSSIENQESIIWLMLAHSGCLEPDGIGCFPHCHEILGKTVLEGKKTFKLVYHYRIGDGENFRMKPGFVNFQKIKPGDELAFNENGPIVSEWHGRIFMPLYQEQGEDGFFVIRELKEEEESYLTVQAKQAMEG